MAFITGKKLKIKDCPQDGYNSSQKRDRTNSPIKKRKIYKINSKNFLLLLTLLFII